MTHAQEAKVQAIVQNERDFQSANPTEAAWLFAYKGTFPFYHSLLQQVRRTGSLSPNQLGKIRDAIERDAVRAKPAAAPKIRASSLSVGDRIEVKAFIARRIQDDHKLPVVFRNLIVTEVLGESAKAIQVKVRFESKVCESCHVCGMELDTEVSRACGIGPVCAKRIGFARPKAGSAEEMLRHVEAFASQIGEVGPVWMPKSQIVTRAPGELPVFPCSATPDAPSPDDAANDDMEQKAAFAQWESEQEAQAFLNKEKARAAMEAYTGEESES